MSSAIVWIVIPLIVGAVLFFTISYRRFVYLIGILFASLLSLAASLLPIDEAISIGPIAFKLSSSLELLGRRLVISQADLTILMVLYGITAFWLVGGLPLKSSNLLPPVTLVMTALLSASLAVEPFLYAAILIEAAVLVSLLLFPVSAGNPNPGIVRYLVFQTFGLPFMLFTGWFLGGLQTGIADPQDIKLALIFLGLGFSFVLAIFPLYSWIPMLAGDENPYHTGFILIMLPTAALFSLLAYVDQYSWLRESVDLPRIFQIAGVVMIVTGGVFSGFQRNLARMFGYAVIVENGLSVLAIGLMTARGYQLFANLFLNRLVAFGLWTICLAFLLSKYHGLGESDLKGAGKRYPLVFLGIMTAQFGIAGFPLLAGFPMRIALMEELSLQNPQLAWWVVVGLAGLCVGAIYSFWVLARDDEMMGPLWLHNRFLNILITVGILFLLWVGIAPNSFSNFLIQLLDPYTHLLPV